MDMRQADAMIIQHCAVFGRLEKRVRAYDIHLTAPYAQYDRAVTVVFVEPRKRTRYGFTIKPDNIRYLTIEVDGHEVYDSRTDVPCDMEAWNATSRRFVTNRPLTSVSGRAVPR